MTFKLTPILLKQEDNDLRENLKNLLEKLENKITPEYISEKRRVYYELRKIYESNHSRK